MRLILTSIVALAAVASLSAQAVKVDSKLPAYKKVAGVTGNLNSVGSDSLNNLMAFWVEAFCKEYPNVKIQVEGKGSGTAPPALIEGTAQLGPMSRDMKNEEIDQFARKFGYNPTRIAVALDTLAVFVHKDNPVKEISLQQLDGIFSKTFKGGHKDIRTWDGAGLSGAYQDRPISMFGRNSASGTYGYFKEFALFKGDYKDTVKEQPGSSSVIQSISSDRFAIGYSGIGYLTSGVRAVPLSDATKHNGEAFAATYENALNGKYPLARYLYIYINKPKDQLDPLVREFIKFVLSKEGQEIVVKDGYLPLTAKMSGDEQKKL
jgi:phosphate transport system substrate-binding protein